MESCVGCKHHIGAGLCRLNLERDCRDCDVCSERPIPADIAEKLGIKPKE